MTADPYTRAIAAIGGTVALSSAVAPRMFFAAFGLPADQATGGAILGWRLMAARTGAISLLAAGGNVTARDLFLPIQIADQTAWWWGHMRGDLPTRTTLMATAASGAIICVDLMRRRAAT